MKKAMSLLFVAALLLVCLMGMTACGRYGKQEGVITDVTKEYETPEDMGMWKDAKYLKDTELGAGATTLTVEVKAEDRQITFTIHTDKKIVGEALMEHGLLEGEDGQYGLFVKRVNGIVADYDVDQTYWGFFIDGEYAMTGVDGTNIEEGVTYCLARTK